ncbi:MAG: alpha/beta hydrolase [Microbacteriaceae bacterium]|nr:MAG: alpha/beta hydrolase [Microbacteriaceae bacterium]
MSSDAPAHADDAASDSRWRVDARAAAHLDDRIEDIDWSRLPDGSIRSTFPAPSGDLAVFSLGDPVNPRVVLVPGVTGSKEDFVLVAPLLAGAGYFVQSYDLPGQYESADAGPRPGEGRYDYALFVDDMIEFLEAGAPAHLLGYSFAGVVAELVLVSRPRSIRSLTLLTTPPLTGESFRGVRWIGPLSRFVTGRTAAGLMIWGILTNKNKVGPSRLAFVRARFASTRRSSVNDIISLMMRVPDVRAAVRAAGVPLLVAVGNHDLWPEHLHTRFAAEIGARISVYETGHSPCETAPHQLAADMLRLFETAH